MKKMKAFVLTLPLELVSLLLVLVSVSSFTIRSAQPRSYYRHRYRQTSSHVKTGTSNTNNFSYRNDDNDIHNPNHDDQEDDEESNNPPPPLKSHPPQRICLMVEPTPFQHVSGYSNRFTEMLRYLSKAGDEVHVLTVDEHTAEDELPREKFGFRVDYTKGFIWPLYTQVCLSLDFQLIGKRILESLKPHVIHVSTPGFMVYAAIIYSNLLQIPLIMSYHTHLPAYANKYLNFLPYHKEISWTILRILHSQADLTLTTSPQIQAEMKEHDIPRVSIWRKGIDTTRFHPHFKNAEMRYKLTNGHPDDFLILVVSRLGTEKRLKDILPILQQLQQSQQVSQEHYPSTTTTTTPNTRLCIVGDGPQASELHTHFQNTNTLFTGQMTGTTLSSAFASADVFLCPSDSETLGFVVLESMASGVPVVAANAGGIPDLISDYNYESSNDYDGSSSNPTNGFLVTPGDTDGYVDALTMLREDEDLRKRMGMAARMEAERWSWEEATSDLRNVKYQEAIRNFYLRRSSSNNGEITTVNAAAATATEIYHVQTNIATELVQELVVEDDLISGATNQSAPIIV